MHLYYALPNCAARGFRKVAGKKKNPPHRRVFVNKRPPPCSGWRRPGGYNPPHGARLLSKIKRGEKALLILISREERHFSSMASSVAGCTSPRGPKVAVGRGVAPDMAGLSKRHACAWCAPFKWGAHMGRDDTSGLQPLGEERCRQQPALVAGIRFLRIFGVVNQKKKSPDF